MEVQLHDDEVHSPSSFAMVWALLGLVLAGAAASIHLTTDSRWMEWHLSRLGEGGHLSSAIFNYTVAGAAVIFTLVAARISEELEKIQPHQGTRLLRNLFVATALCWIGVACFPFDAFPIIHNIFGYGEALILIMTTLGLRHIYPGFSARTYWIGVAASVVLASLLALFLTIHFTTLLFVELVGQIMLLAWLVSMTADLRARRVGLTKQHNS